MSSQNNSNNNAYVDQTWNSNFRDDENVPRPPNPATESRLLGRLLRSVNEKSQLEGNKNSSNTTGPSSLPASEPTQIISSQVHQQPVNLAVHSSLNAEANEFVPRFEAAVVSNPYPVQQYNPEIEYGLSAETSEYLPYGYGDYTIPYYQDGSYEDYEQDPNVILGNFNTLTMNDQYRPFYEHEAPSLSSETSVIERFNQALRVLNLHPANMEEYLRPICEMISKSSDTTETVNAIVESLFNQSIREPNFRYTGARICQFLNTSLRKTPNFSGFNGIFMKRCQKDYNRRDELKSGSKEDQDSLRGLAMFMAEIFLNVEAETPDKTVQRIHFLPKILVNLVETLLSAASDLDVKCSCQLLKLSGGLIEDVVKTSPEDCVKFEQIFGHLQSLESTPMLTENTKFMIGSVLKLKRNDWDRALSSPSKSYVSLTPSEPNFQAPDPVFYKMGTPCSRTEAGFLEEDAEDEAYVLNEEEETAFLIWQAEQDGLLEEQGDLIINDSGYESFRPDTFVDYGGMGDEMEAAYEEFLHKQSFGQGYQAHTVTSSQELPLPTSVPQSFNRPPPNMSQRPEFIEFQPQHPSPSSQQQVFQHYQSPQQHLQSPQQHHQGPQQRQQSPQQHNQGPQQHQHSPQQQNQGPQQHQHSPQQQNQGPQQHQQSPQQQHHQGPQQLQQGPQQHQQSLQQQQHQQGQQQQQYQMPQYHQDQQQQYANKDRYHYQK